MSSSPLVRTVSARIPTVEGEFQLYHYLDPDRHKEHLALVMGNVDSAENVLVRVHSECFTGDVLGSQRCDCGAQLQQAMQAIAAAGQGVLIYLRQEGRGIGLEQKLHAYNLQDRGHDTVDANLLLGHRADEREYSAAAAILVDLGIGSARLLTNNPAKIEALTELGIRIDQRVPIETRITDENEAYLRAKVQRMRHLLSLPHADIHQEIHSHATGNGDLHDGDIHNGDASHPATGQSAADELGKYLAWIDRQAQIHHASTGRPFVTVTYAQTLNGSIAAPDGRPLQISSPASMRLTHRLRAAHDAILVGIGTVLADDPRLTVRLVSGTQPQPVVLDTHLRFPPQAQLLQHPRGVWIATARTPDNPSASSPNGAGPGHASVLDGQITLLSLPVDSHNSIDLPALLRELGRRGIRSIMVEGGAQVLTSFLSQGLANYAVVTISPQYIHGRTMWAPNDTGSGTAPAVELRDVAATPVGSDIILWGHPAISSDAQVPASVTASLAQQ